MKALILVSILVMTTAQGCDRRNGQDSDQELQRQEERQEKADEKREKQEELRQIEERNREVNVNPAP